MYPLQVKREFGVTVAAAYVKECCRNEEKLKELQKFVESRAVEARAKDSLGLNSLMHAAIGNDGKPNQKGFTFLTLQKVHPFSVDEKIEAFELLGSSYILMHDFKKGLRLWEEASLRRTDSRIRRLPEENLPPIISQYMHPEWTDHDDVVKMYKELESTGGKLNIIYQAILVRLALCRSEVSGDVQRQLKFINTDVGLTTDFAVMLFELDDLYGSHSLSLTEKSVNNLSKRIVCHLSCFESRDQKCVNKCLTALKWFVSESLQPKTISNSKIWHSIGYESLILLTVIFQTSLDKSQCTQLKNLLAQLLNWHDDRGMNLLMLLCESLNKHYSNTILGKSHSKINQEYWMWFCDRMEQLVKLFIEVGADVFCADKAGNTCVQLLKINQPYGCVVAPSIFHFLSERERLPVS